MSNYIDADKLKAELKKLSESDNPIEYSSMEKSAYNCALYDVEYLITSLQQERQEPFSCGHENGSEPKPEVELEKEFSREYATYHLPDFILGTLCDGMGVIDFIYKTARHFYELGLKARKEE